MINPFFYYNIKNKNIKIFMVIYVKNNVPGKYVTMDQELDSSVYDNIGTTYYHYCNNYWVKLNDDQIKFHEENPTANVKEVLEMQLEVVPEVDPIIEAKNELIGEIQSYDQSNHVNNFKLNGMIDAWFTVQERLNYKQSVEAAKLLGEETLAFLVNGMPFSISVTTAEYMLAQIQRYADNCYMVTMQHLANANKLTTLEEINNYDYTLNYPKMLEFELV